MSEPPGEPKIYHILHVDRLPSVIEDGYLWADAVVIERIDTGTTIGMSNIKERRLKELQVSTHPGKYVGDFVPFYFCPRSIMLYVIHRGNNLELTYSGGQRPIVHLEANLTRVVAWAQENDRPWAFSLSNAGARYTQFRSDLDDLHEVDWAAVKATDFRSAIVKEGKQAEFLVHQSLPWELIDRVGVLSKGIAQRVADVMHGARHRPTVAICKDWNY